MNSRSLYPVVIALVLGFAAGVAFDSSVFGDGGPESEQAASTRASVVEASATADNASRTSADRTRAPSALSTDTARSEVDEARRNEFALRDRQQEEDLDIDYRDDAFDAGNRDELLPLDALTESETAADYTEYEDGPVRRDPLEAENESADDDPEADGLEEEREPERCRPAYSKCGKDTDCCGSSVCRSRPGTISGFFECTAS